MATLDFVGEMLADMGAGEVQLRGMLDAPLWVEEEPYDLQVVALAEQTRRLWQLANASGRVPADCRLSFSGNEEWRCLFGENRLPLLRTPHLLSFHRYDSWQLFWNMGPSWQNPAQWGEMEVNYINTWSSHIQEFLVNSPVPAGSLYFSSGCLEHCVSAWDDSMHAAIVPTDASSRFKGENVNLLDVLQAWVEHGWRPATGRLVSDCEGFNCDCGGMDAILHSGVGYRRLLMLVHTIVPMFVHICWCL
eukprot:gnl/TRDRNA2_/TRDRNA2_58551_c1_seq1.p1 gnl/TRDRNA2_/TRDRNA2_58551_c1~~gnl/TRDRNA2_/TRDRNA2_58551_c1_seq1.p1  ORF type:complete len:256 (-),score=33.05 gnl/TRDRNA2_/TRDRNA2_58551_c1_seq1:79-822(-)